MNIRKIKLDELDTSLTMSSFAFQYDMTDEEKEERKKWMNPEETWVAEEDGEILAKTTVLPLTTYIAGKPFAMGGVSGVATWPEHRRSGLVRRLLSESLKEMKEKGQTISFLYPFSIPFYRKFGWELFAEKTTIILSKEKLPKRCTVPGSIRRVKKNDEIVGAVYDEWAKQFNGPLKRDSSWWERSTFKRNKGELAVYFDKEGVAKGYLFYQVKKEVLTAHQLIWLTDEARRGLWSFISNHDSMIKEAVVTLPGEDGTVFLLDDPRVEEKVEAYFMARIVDAKAFLSSYPFTWDKESEHQPVIIHLEDEFCEWNNGTYIIKPSRHGGEPEQVTHHHKASEGASCAHPPKRGLTMDIKALTALLMNGQSPAVLHGASFIKGRKEELERLSQLIPTNKAFFYDFF